MRWTRARSRLRSGMVKAGRLQLHHTYGGSGSPPVVFVHGLGSSGYIEWRFNLEPIAAHHRVFAPDLPGYGRSHKPRARYDIAYFARALDSYMESQRLRSAAVVGASLGGRVALEMALEYPRRVSRLVLVNALGLGRPKLQLYYPLVTLPRVGETFMRLAREALAWAPPPLIRRLAARYAAPGGNLEQTLDDRYLASLREMYSEDGFQEAYLATVRSLAHPASILGRHDLSRRLPEIRVPVLLVWGAADPLFPVEHATRAHARLHDSRLALIEGAGHTPQAERPEEFNRILGRFLG